MNQSILAPSSRLHVSVPESETQVGISTRTSFDIPGRYSETERDSNGFNTLAHPTARLTAIPSKSVLEKNGDFSLHESTEISPGLNVERTWRSAAEESAVKGALFEVRSELRNLLRDRNAPLPAPLTFTVSEEARLWLARGEGDKAPDTASLRKTIDEEIRQPLVNEVEIGRLGRGGSVEITLVNERLLYTLSIYND